MTISTRLLGRSGRRARSSGEVAPGSGLPTGEAARRPLRRGAGDDGLLADEAIDGGYGDDDDVDRYRDGDDESEQGDARPNAPAPHIHHAPEDRIASGIWALEADRLVSVEEFDEGPCVVLVRTEHVLVLTTDLPPIQNAAKRRAALPFAIEDRIAAPLAKVHVALGRNVGGQAWLAGVVDADLMAHWVLRLEEAGLEQALLVPDALALPVPAAGHWSVDLAGDRALVRTADAGGFALPLAMLEQAWIAAGRPAAIAYGDPLPPSIHAPEAPMEAAPLAQRLAEPALDLRQGRFARPARRITPLWRRIAIVTAIGALAHGAIAAADTIALADIAADREAEARALAQTRRPELPLAGDLSGAVEALTPVANAGAPEPFLRLVTGITAAFAAAPAAAPITAPDGTVAAQPATPPAFRAIRYDAAAGTMTVELAGGDPSAVQAVVVRLAQSGFAVQPAAATGADGQPVPAFTVGGG